MGRIDKFEDLIAWQKARELSKKVYECTGIGSFRKDFGLKDQIRHASVSVMSNIAEGFERGGRPEFHHFLVIAKGSCGEVRSKLYIAKDIGYLSEDAFSGLMDLAIELSKLIGGLRGSIQKQMDSSK